MFARLVSTSGGTHPRSPATTGASSVSQALGPRPARRPLCDTFRAYAISQSMGTGRPVTLPSRLAATRLPGAVAEAGTGATDVTDRPGGQTPAAAAARGGPGRPGHLHRGRPRPGERLAGDRGRPVRTGRRRGDRAARVRRADDRPRPA